jgi:hypothetical protein
MRRQLMLATTLVGSACSSEGGGDPFGAGSGTTDAGSTSSGQADGATTADDPTGPLPPGSASTSMEAEPAFDLGVPNDTDDDDRLCRVGDGLDAVQPCLDVAPPGSFDPAVQWAWPGEGEETEVLASPIVGNLTDDNGDGEIDLCDVPDVVVVAYDGGGQWGLIGHVYVLDGETGALHFRIDTDVHAFAYPALGDIDDDGVPEIVTLSVNQSGVGGPVAFEHDGTLAWQSSVTFGTGGYAVSLYDLDADDDVEIVAAGRVFDHEGNLVWGGATGYLNTAADLDDDGFLELVSDGTAYHHDGSVHFETGITPSHPHVADIDLDGQPEIILSGLAGISIVEHDGTVTVADAAQAYAHYRPAAIHDMDGDDEPELAVGSINSFSVLETDFVPNWTAEIVDLSGYAAGTGFDFLGDGTAEAMYADETTLYVLDDVGAPLLTTARDSFTQWEYPVVVDVDNDGSAEIVVVSNEGYAKGTSPPVQVIRDAQDRWMPARRIWNQHSYHITNVREDGTIPQQQPANWLTFNTFRTQAQIQPDGGLCKPAG